MSILEKIFKTRKDITYMLDLDMIEDLSQQAYVKRLNQILTYQAIVFGNKLYIN